MVGFEAEASRYQVKRERKNKASARHDPSSQRDVTKELKRWINRRKGERHEKKTACLLSPREAAETGRKKTTSRRTIRKKRFGFKLILWGTTRLLFFVHRGALSFLSLAHSPLPFPCVASSWGLHASRTWVLHPLRALRCSPHLSLPIFTHTYVCHMCTRSSSRIWARPFPSFKFRPCGSTCSRRRRRRLSSSVFFFVFSLALCLVFLSP